MIDASGEFPRNIEKSDIDASPPEIGGTKIVLQRHGRYETSVNKNNVGSLTEAGSADTYVIARDFSEQLFDSISESERGGVDFLIVASDTQYNGGGRRSMETAAQVMKALKEELLKRDLNESQLLNTSGNFRGDQGPRPMSKLREPQIFDESPDFVNFLAEKYGDKNLDFWIAFEEDREKETRLSMNAEGPDEIVNRLKFSTEVLVRYAEYYHKKNPDRRLIIWAATHYDTISPYIKKEIFGLGKEMPVGVDYGAGISINIDKEGNRDTKIAGKKYNL